MCVCVRVFVCGLKVVIEKEMQNTSVDETSIMAMDFTSIEEMDPSLAYGFHIIYSREVGQSVFFPLFVPCNVSFTSFLLQSCLI